MFAYLTCKNLKDWLILPNAAKNMIKIIFSHSTAYMSIYGTILLDSNFAVYTKTKNMHYLWPRNSTSRNLSQLPDYHKHTNTLSTSITNVMPY